CRPRPVHGPAGHGAWPFGRHGSPYSSRTSPAGCPALPSLNIFTRRNVVPGDLAADGLDPELVGNGVAVLLQVSLQGDFLQVPSRCERRNGYGAEAPCPLVGD